VDVLARADARDDARRVPRMEPLARDDLAALDELGGDAAHG
jgi:hypothetical protein